MRPTLRGVGVAPVAGGAFGMAATGGARALNAIAAPAVVVLAIGAIQIVRVSAPTVERPDPRAGFPGEHREIELDVQGSGVARLADSLPGAESGRYEIHTTLPDSVAYELTLTNRGEWTVGPARLVVTDTLGLFRTTVTTEATATLLVYPEVKDLSGDEAFAGFFEQTRVPDRQAFDTLREYAPGDPLRDVHWKSSAKRGEGDLVVKEFVGETTRGTIDIAASAASGHADAMASAAASVAVLALEAGYSVRVTCPDGELPAGHGDEHRRHLLELLARTGAGYPDERAREGADVLIEADGDGVAATVGGRRHRLAVDGEGRAVAADGGAASDANGTMADRRSGGGAASDASGGTSDAQFGGGPVSDANGTADHRSAGGER
jgi:uncharacterized protein (DUF58 family)